MLSQVLGYQLSYHTINDAYTFHLPTWRVQEQVVSL